MIYTVICITLLSGDRPEQEKSENYFNRRIRNSEYFRIITVHWFFKNYDTILG